MSTIVENIVERPMAEEISKSWLTYAMTVVESRAIPSVYDGMKPVVRRCVYGAYEGGYVSSKKTVKSARIVGDVMGQLHPHGDSSVYDTIVGLVQPWNTNIPMFHGVGNWGSLGKEDGPAAQRYCVVGSTRTRLADGTTRTLQEIAEEYGVTEFGEANLPATFKAIGALGEPVPADRILHSGAHPVKTFETASGRTLTGTHNHPVLVLDTRSGSAVVWKRMDELVEGDRVALLRGPAPATQAGSMREVALASLLGAESSGAVVDPSSQWASNLEEATMNAFGTALALDSLATIPGDKFPTLTVDDLRALKKTPLSALAGRSTSERTIPEWIWHAPADVRTALLSNLFEGASELHTSDGIHALTLEIRNRKLARDVQEMLLEHGVSATVTSTKCSHTIAVTGTHELATFQQNVGFASRERQAELCDVLGPVAETANLAGERRGWDNDQERMVSLGEAITNSTHIFDKVVSIVDDGVEDVYSLRIANEDHAFITGGFVSHNTEARLTPAAEIMCQDIHEDAVNMVDNYDASLKEPAVLPSSIPNLLVNGTTGIAVGVACNFAPHDLNEVTDALVHLLKNPDADHKDLMKFITGPDFPTGGIVIDDGGLEQAYRTGRGGIRLRAKAEVEDVSARKVGIVVTELPFNVGPEAVIKKINYLKSENRIDGVGKTTNFTDLKNGLRLVIELKAGANPERVLQELYKQTPLEQTFHFNQLALVGTEPRLMGLVELCQHYLDHRITVITRRSHYRRKKAEARAHIVEGLIKAHDHIDEVVKLIKASENAKDASTQLRKKFDLSEKQAAAILEMTLRRLTGLEISALRDELAELKKTIQALKDLVASDEALRNKVGEELQEVCRKINVKRRSEVVSGTAVAELAPEVVDEPTTIQEAPLALAWDIDGNLSSHTGTSDRPLKALFKTTSTSDVGVVTDKGNLLSFSALGINGGTYPLTEHVAVPEGEYAVGLVPRRDDAGHVVLVTERGFVKKIEVAQFAKKDGLSIMKLKDPEDRILLAAHLPADSRLDLAVISSEAKMLRLDLEAIRAQGRTGGGVAGMKLPEGVKIVGAGLVVEDSHLVTLTDAGSAKATPTAEYPVKGRGGAGVRCQSLKKADNHLVSAAVVPGTPQAASARAAKDVKIVAKRDASGVQVGLSGEIALGWA